MALTTRELLLVMRARDEMSGVIEKNAAALNTAAVAATGLNTKLLGAGLVLEQMGSAFRDIGLAGIDFGIDSVFEAVDFESMNTLIATQAQDLKLTSDEIGEMVRQIASDRAVAIEGLQGASFDVFSTFEGDKAAVQEILDAVAILSVAGNETADSFGGAVAGILNAFDLDSSDALDVADDLFRLAEKGQLTVGEFSSVIGRAVSPALAYGQTLETTGAAIAFLTKETDLSASQASTSAARLFDMLRKNVGTLENVGIASTDAQGNFLDLDQIIGQLADTTQGMSDIELSSFLESIFGQGEIRANRALIPLIKDFEAFKVVLDETNLDAADAAGLLAAYEMQMESSHTAIQELKNAFQFLRIEIGEALLPVLDQLVDWGKRAIEMWNGLDAETRKQIVTYAAIAAVVLTVVGSVMAFVGALMTGLAVLKFFGISLGLLAGISIGAVAAIAAIAAVGILLYQNWDTVKAKVLPIWEAIKEGWANFKNAFNSDGASSDGIVGVIEEIAVRVSAAWDVLKNVFSVASEGIEAFSRVLSGAEMSVGEGDSSFVGLMERIALVVRDTLIPALQIAIEWLGRLASWIIENVIPVLLRLYDEFVTSMDGILAEVIPTLNALIEAFDRTVKAIIVIWKLLSPVVIPILQAMLALVVGVFNQMAIVIGAAMRIISQVIQLVMNLIQGDWTGAWNNVKNIFSIAWNAIVATARNMINTFLSIMRAFQNGVRNIMAQLVALLRAKGIEMLAGFLTAIMAGWGRASAYMRTIPGKIKSVFSGAGSWLVGAGRQILQGLLNGITSKVSAIRNKLSELTNLIPSWKGPADKDAKLLYDAGTLIMSGLERGLTDEWSSVQAFLQGITTPQSFAIGAGPLGASVTATDDSSVLAQLLDAIRNLETGVHIENAEFGSDMDEAVSELDYWAQKRSAGL